MTPGIRIKSCPGRKNLREKYNSEIDVHRSKTGEFGKPCLARVREKNRK